MDTILLMLSGGVDSTCLLFYYLTQTRHPVHVHHISIRYPQLQRWKMEDPAVKKIVDYCRSHYRHFEYSQSRFDLDPMNLVGYDQALQLLVASKVGPNLPGERVSVAIGHCYDDFDSPEAQEMTQLKTMQRLWQVLRESSANKGEGLNPERVRPLMELKWTKEEICRRIPEDLLRLCWSCRRPDYIGPEGIPCGRCKTCLQIEAILSKDGRTADFPNLVRPRRFAHRASNWHAVQRPLPHATPNRPGTPDGAPGHTENAAQVAPPAQPHRRVPHADHGAMAYTAAFRTKLALAALVNGQDEVKIAGQYGVDPATVRSWKQMLIDGMSLILTDGPEDAAQGDNDRLLQSKVHKLEKRIRQLEAQLRLQPDSTAEQLPGDGEF